MQASRDDQPAPVQARLDGYTRFCLTAIAVLLTVIVLGLWTESPSTTGTVVGAEPTFGNTAGQRKDLVEGIQTTNQKLDQIIALLRSGQVKVQLVEPETDPVGPGVQGGRIHVVPAKKK